MISNSIPYVTCILVLINAISYVYETRVGLDGVTVRYGMYKGALQCRGWKRLFYSAFLHSGLFHIISNMICLVSFGVFLENKIGPLWYLFIYFCGIVGAGLLINYVGGKGNHIGASGAIWALMVATLILNVMNNSDLTYAFQGIALNVIYTFSAKVSWQGHIGGCIGGIVAILIMMSTKCM